MPLLRILLLAVVLSPAVRAAAAIDLPVVDSSSVAAEIGRLSPMAADDVLWLARCIYSESDRPHEQRLVAWVVRNRVETRYRGRTYREVVLEAKQFSAFNEPTPRRERILNLTASSPYRPWQTALEIAFDVYQAPASERPFSATVRHFYSPISMEGHLEPHWASSGTRISSASLGVDPFRFRFFSNVDEGAEPNVSDDVRTVEKRGGFLYPVRRNSGRVARPVRPSVQRRH